MSKKDFPLQEIGEFGLIERIIKKIGQKKILAGGIGDDVAVIKTEGKKWLLATCDCQLEDKHFKKEWIEPRILGRRAALVNLSDIASVGGFPKYALISLGLPPQTKLSFADKLYDGLIEEFSKAGTIIVGGNLVSSEKIFLDVFLIGEMTALPILRCGAKVGDYLLVTGTLGDSRAGLEILQRNQKQSKSEPGNHTGSGPKGLSRCEGIGERVSQILIQRFLLPPCHLEFAQALAQNKFASSMIDVSDGLASDLKRIAEQSKVGVELWSEKIPVSKELKKYLAHQDRLEYSVPGTEGAFALKGGEDYELLFTAPKKNLEKMNLPLPKGRGIFFPRKNICSEIKTLAQKTKTKITIIGKIKSFNFGVKILMKNGKLLPLCEKGFDHFHHPLVKRRLPC